MWHTTINATNSLMIVLTICYRSRSPPEGKATVTPPSSATLPPSPTRVAPTIHTFAIPKLNGLGIIVAGGVNRDEGPHIFVDKIMDGMDAARVSYFYPNRHTHTQILDRYAIV